MPSNRALPERRGPGCTGGQHRSVYSPSRPIVAGMFGKDSTNITARTNTLWVACATPGDVPTTPGAAFFTTHETRMMSELPAALPIAINDLNTRSFRSEPVVYTRSLEGQIAGEAVYP